MAHTDAGVNPDALSEERLAQVDLATFLKLVNAGTELTAASDDILRDAEAGINVKEWDVLALIHAMGPSRPSQVLRRVALTSRPQTLSSIIDRLERRGLVARTPHPQDSRGVLVQATPAGVAMVEKIFPFIASRIVRPFASHYTDDEIQTLGDLLARISDNGRLSG